MPGVRISPTHPSTHRYVHRRSTSPGASHARLPDPLRPRPRLREPRHLLPEHSECTDTRSRNSRARTASTVFSSKAARRSSVTICRRGSRTSRETSSDHAGEPAARNRAAGLFADDVRNPGPASSQALAGLEVLRGMGMAVVATSCAISVRNSSSASRQADGRDGSVAAPSATAAGRATALSRCGGPPSLR